jgi:hypothetical protein
MQQLARPLEKEVFDYIGAYEKAIREVIAACGSREAANRLLNDLHEHYQRTDLELRRIKRVHGGSPEILAAKKEQVLASARHEVGRIIEKHVPHTSDHVKELIIGTSLAVTAIMLPVSYAVSTLAVATGIVSIAGSYYIGFKLIRNWKAISGKEGVAHAAGRLSPRHVGAQGKISKWMSLKK